jgi:lysyl-tRNA synthetase, class II
MSVPYRFETTHSIAPIVDQYSTIDDGGETGVTVTLAGRLMLRRDQGKLLFGVLQDATGRIQLFASASWTTEFDAFKKLSLGDWVGATGEVVKTKKGELSVKVTSWCLLAEARRPFPDKWHGRSASGVPSAQPHRLGDAPLARRA